MLHNYLKIALRSFTRNKGYTILNLVGLSTGLTTFILIVLYVNYEFSFDNYHEHKDRIYRIVKEDKFFYQGSNKYGVTPAPLGPVLPLEFPEIEKVTRIDPNSGVLIGVGDKVFFESRIHGLDSDAFKIFTFNVAHGDIREFLTGKYTAVLSRSASERFFGDENPIGKTIRYRDKTPFAVVGVIEDMPKNSHFRMDVMLDFESTLEADNQSLTRWNSNSYYTYFLVKEGADPEQIEARFPQLRDKYTNDKIDEDGQSTRYFLQEFTDIHLFSDVNFDIAPVTNGRLLRLYLLIAFLILVIACVNYVNLATARALKRAKEVGIRKVVGAVRGNLIMQFLVESLALSFIALVVSLVSAYLILPVFSQFTDRDLTLQLGFGSGFVTEAVVLFVAVGIISGAYPAYILSSVRPVHSLKGGSTSTGTGKSTVRNALVILQFTISGILIIGTLVIYHQMQFIQNKEMGYDRDQIVVIFLRDQDLRQRFPVFKNALLKIPGVSMVAVSSSLPNNIGSNSRPNWPGKPEDLDIPLFYHARADHDFLDLYGIEMAAGRNFSEEMGDGKNTMLINETAASMLGWEQPLGQQMISGKDTARIIGIIKDFHQHSLHLGFKPLQLFFGEDQRRVSIKIESEHFDEVITSIEETYNTFSSKYPFDYQFFDDIFYRAYQNEQRTSVLATWSTFLTIIIACLGLYGLATYSAERRLREIGIRKVLGATLKNLLILLSKDFAILIMISFLIAIPVAYYAIGKWLENFAFHVPIGAVDFLVSFTLLMVIGGVTIGYRTFMACSNNPVDVLRNE